MASKKLRIIDESGIHARPATYFVQTTSKYPNNIGVEYDGKTVNAKSIMGIMSLAVPYDATITIIVDGSDSETIISEIINNLKEQQLV